MAITNHAQSISIYQMVLDRLPFIVDDSNNIFALAIDVVDAPNRQLQVVGDYTKYIWQNQVHTVTETSANLIVSDLEATYAAPNTTINYLMLQVADAAVGNTLNIEANKNEKLISRFIYQMMVQLNSCFEKTDAELGDEQYYSDLQRMLIAEMVAYYIVLLQSMANSGGGTGGVTSSESSSTQDQLYVKSAKTGETTVTWDVFDIKKSAFLSMDAAASMEYFKSNALCLAKALGCQLEVCADGGITCSGCANNGIPIIEGGFILADKLTRCR